ncbi:Lrp/AsnC family transcriptional regulator [Vibrio metschnikovii]|uniref:Lrp/AsnC family transcriptional regulator n=1 Tax=Vibrio metschnikovii TaxID=28172 RepID=UPI001C2F20A8|nr:Lrp/AsnC family transcriptional regulator [Vibrio metschnikovii]
MSLDKIDLQILGKLEQDARLTIQELANAVALSSSACHRRVKRLEQESYIIGYHAKIDRQKIGKVGIEAILTIKLEKMTEEIHRIFLKKTKELDEVTHAYIISGQSNYILHVNTADFESYSEFITNKINKISGISEIHSQLIMKVIK